jgi:hypothetical protein
MASLASELQLRPDEFAFYFQSEAGVEAHELGVFLQRAATVARGKGAELRVSATKPGSLAIILRAARKSPTTEAAGKEFAKAPIATTAASVALAGAVAGAIIYAMNPQPGQVTPLAKAGAKVIEKCHVQQIEVITVDKSIVVMDQDRAQRVRQIQRVERRRSLELPPREVQMLIGAAREGMLSGGVVDVEGELHFRPDGYRYLVPINMDRSEAAEDLYPQAHFRVRADLRTLDGQPDTIIIHSATRV